MNSLQSFEEEHKKIMDSMEASVRLIKKNCKHLRQERSRELKRIRLRNEREAARKETVAKTQTQSSAPLPVDSAFADIEPPWMQRVFQPRLDPNSDTLPRLAALLREAPFGKDVFDVYASFQQCDPVEHLLRGSAFCDLIRNSDLGWVNLAVVDSLFDVLILSTKNVLVHGSYRGLQALLDREYQQWMPDVGCFTKNFRKCGYIPGGSVIDWEEMDERAAQGNNRSTDFINIKVRLLLSLIPTVTKRSPSAFIPKGGGGKKNAVELVCMVAHFLLDFSAESFQKEVSDALEAVIGCVDDGKLPGLVEEMVNGLVELGPTHRSQLRLLDGISEATMMGRSFKRLWAMASLRRCLPKQAVFKFDMKESQPLDCLTALVELMSTSATLIMLFESEYKSSGGKVVPMDWWRGDSLLDTMDKAIHLCLHKDSPLSDEQYQQLNRSWGTFRQVWMEYTGAKGSMNSVGSVRIQYRLKLLKLSWESSEEGEEEEEGDDLLD